MKCTICANPMLAGLVNPLIDQRMFATSISSYANDAGISVSPEVINRHKQHYVANKQLKAPDGVGPRDAATIIKKRILDALDNSPCYEGEGILNKDVQPALRTALAAQKTEDERERAKTQKGTAELAFAIIAMITGSAPQDVPLIDDGMTFEGDFEELDGEAD